MSPAAINPLMSMPLDSQALPEILYLDDLPESSLFSWNWPIVCERVIKEKVLLVTKNKFVYHSLRRALPNKKKFKVRRREHERGFVFQIADAKSADGPITTRSNKTAQKSNHGVFQKMAEELLEGGIKPEGAILEVEYKTAMIVRTLFYGMRKKTKHKVSLAFRVRQPNGTYLPLKKVPNFAKQMITIFSYSGEAPDDDAS